MFSALASVALSATMAVAGTGWTWTSAAKHAKSILINCEDTTKTPCITFDDGKWKRVDSYSPYRAKVISKCKTAKGGPKYPCAIAKDRFSHSFNYFK